MSLLDLSVRWVVPGLMFLADWSVRWGVLLVVLLLWWAIIPPRRAAVRYLLGVVLLASGILLPAVPRWGSVAIPWPGKGHVVAEPKTAEFVPPPPGPVAKETDGAPTDESMRPPMVIQETVTHDRPRATLALGLFQRLTLGRWQWTALAVAVVWALAVFVLSCRLIGGMVLLARLRRESGEVDEMSRRLLDDCRQAVSLSRRVALAAHPSVGSPFTLGGRRPIILVPSDWASWTESDRRVCLLHELAHLASRDDWVKLVQEIVRVPFFFHPLVQWLMKRIDRERELLCDERVVALGVDPPAYARLLLDIAKRPGRLLPFAAMVRCGSLPFLDRATVAARIERLLETDMNSTLSSPSAGRLFVLGAVVLAVAMGAGGLGVQTVETREKKGNQATRPAGEAEPAAGRQITGVILGPDAKPAAGAIVVAGLPELEKPDRQIFKTGADGRFSWSIPEGPVTAYFVAFKEGLAPVVWTRWLDATNRGDQVEIKLINPEPFSATLINTAGQPIAGALVRIEMLASRISSPGAAAETQSVMMSFSYVRREVIGTSPLQGVFETTTDRNGSFTFRTSGPEIRLMLGVTAVRDAEMRVRAEKEVRGGGTTVPFDEGFVAAPPGEPTRLVAFPAARVRGRVVTKLSDVSVAGLKVTYEGSIRPGEIPRQANFGTQRVITGPDGQFVIGGLSEGTINVFVHGKGEGESWTYRAAPDVALKTGKTTEIVLELIRGVEVEGTVVARGTGTPIVGARVGVYGPSRPRTSMSSQPAETDNKGRYHFRLPPGETYVYVMAPPVGFTPLPGEGSSRTVTIPDSTMHYEVPAIEVATSATVRGYLLDVAGSPAAGATIVGRCEGNLCRPFPGKETLTNARGEFQLPTREYSTVAKGEPARFRVRLRDGAEHDAALVPNDSGIVIMRLAVRNKMPAGVEAPRNLGPFELTGVVVDSHAKPLNSVGVAPTKLPAQNEMPAGAEAPRNVAPDELAGVVVDSQGKPLQGVLVDAWTWYPGNETRTNARGEFRLRKLGNGQKVEVVFRKAGYTPQLFVTQPTGKQGWVVVLGNKTYFEGTVTGPEGKPVGDALIRANQGPKQAEGVRITEIWTETRTDAEGRYRLYAQPDVYDIQVRVPSAGTARLKDTAIGSDESKRLDIALQPGVKFRAKAVDSLTGKPVAGVRLWHWQHKGTEGQSDQDGMVTIADMLPGPFSFQVKAPGYTRWWSEQSSTAWHRRLIQPDRSGRPWQRNFDDLAFDLRPGMDLVTITLEPAVKINGEVRDPDGKPVAGATVAPALTGTGNSLTGDTRFSVKTDAKGHFEMELPASGEHEYNLVAHDGKYQQWRTWANGVHRPFSTKPGERLTVVLTLTKPARVRGRVVDGNGKPVAGREVRAGAADRLENRYYDPTAKTAADGRFELKYVRPGEQFIQVAPFWLDAMQAPPGTSQSVTVKPGETKEDVELHAQ